jgi:hypothetical protein
MTRWLLAVLVVLVLLLLFSLGQSGFLYSWLQGAWEGDRAFCEETGVGGMILYVGPYDPQHSGWRSFLLMFSEDVTLHAQILYLSFSGLAPLLGPLAPGGLGAPVEGSLAITPGDLYVENTLPVEDLMPLELSLLVDPLAGTMSWRADDTEYARFFKDYKSAP